MSLDALVTFVCRWRTANPLGTKGELVVALSTEFSLMCDGALLIGREFAVRVSQNRTDTGFPNTVVAFKKIVRYDDRPVVVCLLTPQRCVMLLANTTFLQKVSHSSHGISERKLVGSILGSDILAVHGSASNTPDNFATLWAAHERADRAMHRARIIAATQAIGVAATVWSPSPLEVSRILAAPGLAHGISDRPEYLHIAEGLETATQRQRSAILAAARDANAKTRGDCIEELVTGVVKNQGLGDLTVQVLATTVSIDVKSKRLDLSSAPKAYNVDKMLRELALGSLLLAVLFVGVDPVRDVLATRLVSVFDGTLLAATRIDARWSGRRTRGTAQFSRAIDAIWSDDFRESIDVGQAQTFLRGLMGTNGAAAGAWPG